MPYALRTRFKKEIVAEFLPPHERHANKTDRAGKSKTATKRQRVVIICSGAPGLPANHKLLEFFSHKGFWAIYPRYRGSWESDGIFLKKSPEQDILDIINELPRGFKSAWDGKKYRVRADEIFIIASSFGGPAGILASRDSRVKKVIAVSPVVDWQAPSKTESLEFMEKFFREAFGNGYRFGTPGAARHTWKKLTSGKFYNPATHSREIDGSKLLIFHAYDDESVRWNEVAKFSRTTGATLKIFKRGGHLSASRVIPKYWPQIAKFFRENS